MGYAYAIPLIFGLLFGSFLNAWMYRTRARDLSITKGRSICPGCKKTLRACDNIPLISFLFLKGRCHFCKKLISKQYPIVEAVAAVLFLLVTAFHVQMGSELIEIIRDCILVYFLLFVFVYDFLYQEIWDRATTIPALMYIPFALYFSWQSWQSILTGACIGAGFFATQFFISTGRWVGGGDIRLGFFMGVVLGFPGILLALLLAYVMGAFWSVVLIFLKYKTIKDTTAFGTYLSIAAVITLFFGEPVIRWYLSLLW